MSEELSKEQEPRQAFEVWAKKDLFADYSEESYDGLFWRGADGEYRTTSIIAAWRSWQAAKSAPPSPQADAWVSVQERLPQANHGLDDYAEVLGHWPDSVTHQYAVVFYKPIDNSWWVPDDDVLGVIAPSHWRELPAPPQPEAKAKELPNE